MPNMIVNALNSILPTPEPELRADAISLLDMEIERARNEVFGDGAVVQASKAYIDTFELAVKKLEIAINRNWVDYKALELPTLWLALLGFRFSIEDSLPLGGLVATQLRAAERLNLSPRETRDWDIELMHHVYLNTALRHDWNYEGLHFRFEAD